MCNYFTLSVLGRVKHSNVQLDHLIYRDDQSGSKLNQLAETNVAILKSSIENITTLEVIQGQLGKLYEVEQQISRIEEKLANEDVSLRHFNSEIMGKVSSGLLDFERKLTALEQQFTKAATDLSHNFSKLEEQFSTPVIKESSDFLSIDPETSLMIHMYSFLENNIAIDVGAHKGRVAEQLSKIGYDVFAFEPNEEVFKDLREVENKYKNLNIFNFAIGAQEKQGYLHLVDIEDPKWAGGEDNTTMFSSLVDRELPEHFESNSTSKVSIKTLCNLIKNGDLPANIGILKIDTEGYDLEVIKGLGETRPSIVVAEYWDKKNPWSNPGLIYSFSELVFEMKGRGYNWHIDIQRFWGKETVSFSCNHSASAVGSWGNVFFFKTREHFNFAHDWCANVLPRTFYKPIQNRIENSS